MGVGDTTSPRRHGPPISAQLPVETWAHILSYLPAAERIPALSVNRLLHDVALRFVHSSVHIHLGAWETVHPNFNDLGIPAPELLRRNAQRSAEILQHIVTNARFAKNVRKLSVYAFAPGDAMRAAAMRLLNILTQALERLPNLTTFHWIGCEPLPVDAVIDYFVSRIPPLKELRIPARPFDAFPRMLAFNSLASLCLSSKNYIEHMGGYNIADLDAIADTTRSIILNNVGSLLSLTVFASVFDHIAPDSLGRSLVELDVWACDGLTAIYPILSHCPRLTALALLEVTCTDPSSFHPLAPDPPPLPRLSSFKLIALDEVSRAQYAQIAAFLAQHPALRRLDLDMPCRDLEPILALLPDLERLQVLGLDVRAYPDLARVADALPRGLRALHVQTRWDLLPVEAEELKPLVDAIFETKPLTMLHFENVFMEKQRSAETFVKSLPELEVIMLRDDCWTVYRELPLVPDARGQHVVRGQAVAQAAAGMSTRPLPDAATAVQAEAARTRVRFWLEKWPRGKVVFRTADDYTDPDHEWLLRFHGIQDDLTDLGSEEG
ncbi:hypothetical protein PUNSTDRAFT_42110 [Punctularia strigosozonata HHB-11173 SS5]|uniref:uncharacterized protein n=1 Tax=Punctularia strigosozonata (strain HHB-11173) TaxID=741275 RepID=UPI0004417476|nr:uncharacterized protein PUNSTDRAFT_42110 [Punctularia strigosozonata HHB-11173 SS5]EIN12519.1 hypothetical protein PUNSTDRAFT_42110 [Punctularia strigosozonata HHB-11173 SS5]